MKQIPNASESVMRLSICMTSTYWLGPKTLKWCSFGAFACILLPVIHFLFELLGLFLVNKRQSCQTFLKLKRVKERSVLIVIKRVIDLLVPYHAAIGALSLMSVCLRRACKATYRDVDHLDPVCISNQIVG